MVLLGIRYTIAASISSDSPKEADIGSISLHTWGQTLISIIRLSISENEQTLFEVAKVTLEDVSSQRR